MFTAEFTEYAENEFCNWFLVSRMPRRSFTSAANLTSPEINYNIPFSAYSANSAVNSLSVLCVLCDSVVKFEVHFPNTSSRFETMRPTRP